MTVLANTERNHYNLIIRQSVKRAARSLLMRRFAERRRTCVLFALAAAGLLRLLVPAGYMPAPLSSGWPVQICPDGLPASAVHALLGQSHHHHHHHHLGKPAAGTASTLDGATSAEAGAMAMPQPCELGAGFAGAIGLNAGALTLPALAQVATWHRPSPSTPDLRLLTAFLSRAPPHRPA